MHYKINEKIVVSSENAALSTQRVNKEIEKTILQLPKNCNALDYGCGKLRHTLVLSKVVNRVVAIDSEEQLCRNQIINGKRTSVYSYVSEMLNVEVYNTISPAWRNKEYDFILCSNVLSAIPIEETRINVLKDIFSCLKPHGKALISLQYRNTYYKQYSARDNVIEYNGGWIIRVKNQYRYYGIIMPERLLGLLCSIGFQIDKEKRKDGSIYILVQKPIESSST